MPSLRPGQYFAQGPATSQQPSVLQHGQNILALQLRVVFQDFLICHTRSQQIEQHDYWPAHAAHNGLAMTDFRIDSDAFKVIHNARIYETQAITVRFTISPVLLAWPTFGAAHACFRSRYAAYPNRLYR